MLWWEIRTVERQRYLISLTGSNQHVGNFPGVTVDRKTGSIKGHPNTEITDLPGIYSMSPYSSEEIVSRNFVIE